MDVRAHNREAWNKEVETGNRWTIPVRPDEIAAALHGNWGIFLTSTKTVPRDWFPPLAGAEVLCLASGGGQQGPILAAAGAVVTVYDNSPRQLEQDVLVAEREELPIITIEGDMADLGVFPDEHFDLIVHPVSNTFAPEVNPVWREAYRVLKDGGALLSGFTNPWAYLFDFELEEKQRILQVRHHLPYSDLDSLTEAERLRLFGEDAPLEYSHTLDDQIGGQIAAGFVISGFYEDRNSPDEKDLLSEYTPYFIATRAEKLNPQRY